MLLGENGVEQQLDGELSLPGATLTVYLVYFLGKKPAPDVVIDYFAASPQLILNFLCHLEAVSDLQQTYTPASHQYFITRRLLLILGTVFEDDVMGCCLVDKEIVCAF